MPVLDKLIPERRGSAEVIGILVGARKGKKDLSLSIREKGYVLARRITAAGRTKEQHPRFGRIAIDGDKRREILGLLYQFICRATTRDPGTICGALER